MYNRYVPQQPQAPVREESARGAAHPDREKYKQGGGGPQGGFGNFEHIFSSAAQWTLPNLDSLRGLWDRDKFKGLDSLLSALNLQGLDSGDLLLLLIILLLLVEGDNLEIVITLGLMLVLSLGEEKKKDPDRADLSGSDD